MTVFFFADIDVLPGFAQEKALRSFCAYVSHQTTVIPYFLHSLFSFMLSFIHSFIRSFTHSFIIPSDSDVDDRREQPVQPRVPAEELLAPLPARSRHVPEGDAGHPAREHSEDVRQPRSCCR